MFKSLTATLVLAMSVFGSPASIGWMLGKRCAFYNLRARAHTDITLFRKNLRDDHRRRPDLSGRGPLPRTLGLRVE